MKTPKTKRIRLRITRTMIKRAQRYMPGRCVGAVALKSVLPERSVYCLWTVFVVDDIRFPMSKPLMRYTAMFDAGKPVRPRTFYVRVPA